MSRSLPLKEMTVQEKLSAMELLWDDLARDPESVKSPEWHKTVLDGRRQRAVDGLAQFQDWATAKDKIRNKVR